MEGTASSVPSFAKSKESDEALPSKMIKIWKAEVVEKSSGAACRAEASERRPGEILSADKTGIVVGCGERALRILELQRESGKRLTAEQFLAGFPLLVGWRFD
jgi:methionyl-tRNA formyltransferase